MLLCPAVIEVGSNAHVAPVEQESVMLLMKELAAEAETVKVVDVVPMTRAVDRTLAESVNSAFPVPWSETPCGLFPASSVMLIPPARSPLPVGVNVTLKAQLSPTLRTAGRAPHELV